MNIYCKLETDWEKKMRELRFAIIAKKCFSNIFSFSQQVTGIRIYFTAQIIHNL